MVSFYICSTQSTFVVSFGQVLMARLFYLTSIIIAIPKFINSTNLELLQSNSVISVIHHDLV